MTAARKTAAVALPATGASRRAQALPLPRNGGERAGGLRCFDPAAVAERLLAEFAGRVDAATVRATVADCAADISAVPAPALPELVERSARQRLTVLCRPPYASGTATPSAPRRRPVPH